MTNKASDNADNNKPKRTFNGWLILIGLAVVMTIIIIVLSGGDKNTEKKNTETTTTPSQITQTTQPAQTETPKADSSLLNATVKKSYDIAGIEITNNEAVNWDECKLVLNDDYKRTIRNPLQPNEPLNNPYGLFTKSDGTRFDNTNLTPKSLLIDCKVNGSPRQNVYMF